MNDHLLHRVQQKIRSFLACQASHEADPQGGDVADDDPTGIDGRYTVRDSCHPLGRIAQRQRGDLLFAGHRDHRCRPANRSTYR